MIKPKILLISPSLNVYGGVSEFNKMILRYSKMGVIPFYLTSAGKKFTVLKRLACTIYDFFRYFFVLLKKDIKIVHANPSLGCQSILRDSILILLAKLLGKKVFVHWHGWNPKNEYLLKQYKYILRFTLFRADHIRLLAVDFKNKLIESGYSNITSLGNTFIDDSLLEHKLKLKKKGKYINLLFLSTVSKNKGIYESLKSYRRLKKKYPHIKLVVAGVGAELEAAKKFVLESKMRDVEFRGYVSGPEKIKAFREADIYIFPSHYEGMPTSVIEAMGFGLPVVCNAVGALPDFFTNTKMGFIINSPSITKYYDSIEMLILNRRLRKVIGIYNHDFVQKNFLATNSVERIDEIYNELYYQHKFL